MTEIKTSHIQDKEIKINCKIIVVSDSLSKIGKNWLDKDKSGNKAKIFLESKKNLSVVDLIVISDNLELIQAQVRSIFENNKKNINFILTIGGTGISKGDITIEAIRPLLDKELPGFGEIFRFETYKQLKTIAIMSRAIAGVKDNILFCCLPGSPNAIELGLQLIEPEILHILNLRNR